MKLKKGSIEAKRYMAKIRAMKSGTKKKATKKKSLGATKFVEKKEPKSTKPKRTIQITRKADGTFKKFKQIGATKFVEKKEPKSTKPKRTIQITRKADGTFKKFKQIGSIHKDTKSHNVRINVLSGIKTPSYYDKDMAREISLFADNDADLYRQSKQPILKNLAKKYQKGTFKVDLASKLWVYYIENALKKYHKMYGNTRASWSTLMKPADRKLLAMEYAQDTLNDFNNGEFNY
jgi:hypothetical protein